MPPKAVSREKSNAPEESSEPAPDASPEIVNYVSEGSEATDDKYQDDFGEGSFFGASKPKDGTAYDEDLEDKEWVPLGEYGEAGKYYFYRPEVESEYPSIWEKISTVSSVADESEEEVIETEEEKELRKQREILIAEVRKKTLDRILIQAKNSFLHKTLVEHFKKRRMDSVFQRDQKGFGYEVKYLRKLFLFQEFKESQEAEIIKLESTMKQNEQQAKILKDEVDEKLKGFMNRAYEISLNLISSKTGKKLNEKQVDRLLRRQIKKSEEKGKKKLKYIKLKILIEEKARQLKEMEHIGEGLYYYEYEQIKIDNENYNDKIEERDEELTKVREKTHQVIQHLANVREKTYAIEGDIELMEEQVYEVEKKFIAMRQRLTMARKKRDSVREEYARLKASSGLLTKNALLQDFEDTYFRVKSVGKQVERLKKIITDKTKQHTELTKLFESNTGSDLTRAVDSAPSVFGISSKRLI